MIIGMALKEVFKGKTIKVGADDVSVQFHFGDQKEFNNWIAQKMLSRSQKYPLIWYVINEPEPQGDGKLRVNTQLILFQGTNSQIFNDKRYETTYLNYLEPLYELVNYTLSRHKYVSLLHNGLPIPYLDEPNFGVDSSQPNRADNDFTKKTPKGEKGITIDIVDAKILRLNMEITPKCIIKK